VLKAILGGGALSLKGSALKSTTMKTQLCGRRRWRRGEGPKEGLGRLKKVDATGKLLLQQSTIRSKPANGSAWRGQTKGKVGGTGEGKRL